MKKIIIANFKMNQTPSETKNYLLSFLAKTENLKNDVVICPPFTSLSVAGFLIEGSNISLGAQNLSDKEEGAETGEISAKMLKALNTSYVIVGHSERRKKFGEDDKLINKKVEIALKNGFKTVICVGETEAQRISNKTVATLKKQIEGALSGLYENELSNIIFAYEPVWAIGTGKSATEKQIEETVATIREVVKNLYSQKASVNLQILYGGSVNEENCSRFSKCKGINGFLVGSASLNVEKFIKICR